MLSDKGGHLLLGKSVDGFWEIKLVGLAPVLNQLVGPEALLALLTVHQGIGKAAQMAGGNPSLRIHQNGGVEPDVVGILLNKFFPPGLFHVVLQLNAQRTVIPGVGKTAINLAARENKAPALAQGHKFLHGFLGVLHVFLLFQIWLRTKKTPRAGFTAQGESKTRGST